MLHLREGELAAPGNWPHGGTQRDDFYSGSTRFGDRVLHSGSPSTKARGQGLEAELPSLPASATLEAPHSPAVPPPPGVRIRTKHRPCLRATSGHVEFLETCFLRTDLPNGLPASPLSAPAADQMNPSTWHHLVPCGGRPKPDGTPCVVFMVCFYGYFGRGRLSLPSVRLQPLFFPAPLSPGAGPTGSHTRCYFCYSSVCAFRLFPGRAFLKLLELVAFACICEVCAICLAPCFQFRFTCR